MSGLTLRVRQAGRGIALFLIILLELVVLAAVGAVAYYQFQFNERVYEGVSVAGIPLGGMTLEEAARTIQREMTPYPGETLILRHEDRTWVLGPDDLGVGVDAQTTAVQAFAVGRSGAAGQGFLRSLMADLGAQGAALAAGRRIKPVLQYDEGQIAVVMQQIVNAVDLPPREATLTINGLDISSTPGYAGRRVNQDALHYALSTLAQAGAGGVVDLEVAELEPALYSTEEAAEQARRWLAEPIILTADGLNGRQTFAVDRAMMADWLTFTPTAAGEGALSLTAQADRTKIAAFLDEIAKQIDLPAFDGQLDFDPEAGKAVVLKRSVTGQKLEREPGVDAIEQALLGTQRAITLPVTTVLPRVDSDRVAEMGIVELISQGTTYFKGSSTARVKNIEVAAEKFRGVVIPPGEIFSFNQHVGDVSTANGFVDSLIIRGDRTEVGVGGGVCQVSTTAFQAAFWGGFPIIERYPHSYAVSYYDPPGLDATIFTPTADFRFRNDTGHYLLIRPEVDAAKSRVTFYLYGTKDRTAEMVGKPEISNVRTPEAPIYEESQDLAAGKMKQVDWAKTGMDVLVRRRIAFNDGRVIEDKFLSKYRPWRSVYLYGPGTTLPTEAGG